MDVVRIEAFEMRPDVAVHQAPEHMPMPCSHYDVLGAIIPDHVLDCLAGIALANQELYLGPGRSTSIKLCLDGGFSALEQRRAIFR